MHRTALFLSIMLVGMTALAGEPTQAPGAPAKGVEHLSRDGVFIVSPTPPLYPAAKKTLVRDGMTVLQLVRAVGPGWCSPDEGVGILSWAFSDGSLLQVWPAGAEMVLRFEKRDGTAHMWWVTDEKTFRKP